MQGARKKMDEEAFEEKGGGEGVRRTDG